MQQWCSKDAIGWVNGIPRESAGSGRTASVYKERSIVDGVFTHLFLTKRLTVYAGYHDQNSRVTETWEAVQQMTEDYHHGLDLQLQNYYSS